MRSLALLLIAAASAGAQIYPMPGPRNAPSSSTSATYTYSGIHAISAQPDPAASTSFTAPTLDTSGHNFPVVIQYAFAGSAVAPTDSYSNTWAMCGSAQDTGGFNTMSVWYPTGTPTVGPNHTFTLAAGSNSSIAVLVFDRSGGGGSPCDQSNGAAGGPSSTLAPGSITPTVNNALVVAGCATWHASSSTNSYAGPFTTVDSLFDASNLWGTSAYQIQSTAAATNVPCVNSGGSANTYIAMQASFK